jgi:hypothetical protein
MTDRTPASNVLLFKLEPVDPNDWDYPEVVSLADHPLLLNENERKSVNALIAYVAYGTKTSESEISQQVAQRFGVNAINQLQDGDYDGVIRFLVEMVTFELLDEPESQTIN